MAAEVFARTGAAVEYVLREWHEADGLPEEEVGSVMLDEAGYLWVATTGGLSRFDGVAFETEKVRGEVLSRGMVYAGGEEGRGIFFAVPAGGERSAGKMAAGFFRGGAGDFEFEGMPGLAGKAVRVVFRAADGAWWFGADDGALLRRTEKGQAVFEQFSTGDARRRVPVFASDGKGRTWVSAGAAVARFEGGAWVSESVDTRDNEVRVASSEGGGVWLFTKTELLRWNADRGVFVEVAKLPELLGAHFVQTTLEDRAGTLWVGTRSQGLYRLEGNAFARVATSNDEVTSLCEDADGNLWVGTNGGGLNRLRQKAHRIYDQASGLKDNFSFTVAEGEGGEVWLGNRDGGVARIVGGAVDPISRRMNWRPFSARSVQPAAGGGWWITTGVGIYKTDAGRPETVLRVPELANARLVRVSHVARNGDYWIALDPDRIGRFRGGVLTTFGKEEGFDARELRAIAEDGTGAIWAAGLDGRLCRQRGEKFETVALPEPERFGALQALRFEEDGTLLVGTTRFGVLIAPQGDFARMRALHSDHGLPVSNISGVLADDGGRYWFASRGGVFWVHRSQVRDYVEGRIGHVHAVLLGRDDGLPDLSCSGLFQPSVWKGSGGELWFATQRGVLRTEPSLVPEDADLPAVTIAEIASDGAARAVADELEIMSTTRKTEVRFSVLNLTAPDRTAVRYRLEGFDDDWVVAKDRRAVYPRLPAGKYVLHASASNGGGAWDEQPPILTIVVTPAWWQSVWARVLFLLGGVAVVAAAVRAWLQVRWRRRLAKMEQERAIERERTRIAQDIHDDIGASLTRISLLSQSAGGGRTTPPDVLEQIYDTASTITRSMDEIVWAINPKFDDLESLVYYLTTYAQKFLAAAKVRFRLEAPDTLPAMSVNTQVRHHVFLCCKEALNNVVKHSGASEVTLTVVVESGVLRVEIADDGGGAQAEVAGVGGRQEALLRVSAGNGLKNMRERMADLGGCCTVSARTPRGMMVRFEIPLASGEEAKNVSGTLPTP